MDPVDLAGNVSLEAADDLLLGFALGGPLCDISSGALIASHTADGDHVQRSVGVAVAVSVQTPSTPTSSGAASVTSRSSCSSSSEISSERRW